MRTCLVEVVRTPATCLLAILIGVGVAMICLVDLLVTWATAT
ncbi:hypothetical protein [Rhodopirellula islandica]|nr:hypothetical protein [Rhodopirellula islandica]